MQRFITKLALCPICKVQHSPIATKQAINIRVLLTRNTWWSIYVEYLRRREPLTTNISYINFTYGMLLCNQFVLLLQGECETRLVFVPVCSFNT